VEEREALPLCWGKAVEMQTVGGDLQSAVRHIQTGDPRELSLA
jgi:hypothetical protein